VAIVGVAACADFHGFQAKSADFVEHGVERKMFVDRIEDADGNFAQMVVRARARRGGSFGMRRRRGGRDDVCGSWNGGGQQASGGRKKLPSVNGGIRRAIRHARLLEKRSRVSTKDATGIIRQWDGQTSGENRFSSCSLEVQTR
jgi:hypothetical protein